MRKVWETKNVKRRIWGCP